MSPKVLLRDLQSGPWGSPTVGTLETVTEITEPQQSHRVDVAPGGCHLDSQAIHSHCLKLCITPRIYLGNAEGLLSSNHRISDLDPSSVFNLITLWVSKVEPPEADPPIECSFYGTLLTWDL